MRDDEDPFDEFFDEIERMMNQMFNGNAEFRFEHSRSQSGTESHDVHVDIHETDDEVRVVADIPGVTKSAIDLKCDGQTLMLEAGGDERSYSERLSLPTSVDEEAASATYNNGILEVVFPRTDDSTSIDI
jgi:HSP20 family protein